MEQNILLTNIDLDELAERIAVIVLESISKTLSETQLKPPESESKLMTRHETADFLRISLVTLSAWQKAGQLRYRRVGRRIFFLKSEILKDINKHN